MQLSHAPADTVRANRAMLRRKPPEQRLASISSYSSDSDSKATVEARGGLMRTSWAWQVVGDSRAGFSRLASVAILRAKDLRGRSKVNNYFIKFSHSFLSDMNFLFEQDPTSPFAALLKTGLPFILPNFLGLMTRVLEVLSESRVAPRSFSKCSTVSSAKKFWDLCRTLTTMCQSLARNHPLWTRTMSPFFHWRISPVDQCNPPWFRLSTSMFKLRLNVSVKERVRCD